MLCQMKKKLTFEQGRSDSLMSGAATSHGNARISRSGITIILKSNGHIRFLSLVKPMIDFSKHQEWRRIENIGALLAKDMHILKIILVISTNGERRPTFGLGTWQKSTRNWLNWRRAPCIDRECAEHSRMEHVTEFSVC